jgi:hypothetical protein
MPKNAINYENTIFYKIVCKDLDVSDCYVGHTTGFAKRKQQHKRLFFDFNSKAWGSKVYQVMRDNGGWENWTMLEIEKRSCVDSSDARKKEREYMELLGADLNSVMPYRSVEEAKEVTKQYNRQYRKINKETVYESNRQYRENNKDKFNRRITCECGCEISNASKSAHKHTMKHIERMKILNFKPNPQINDASLVRELSVLS